MLVAATVAELTMRCHVLCTCNLHTKKQCKLHIGRSMYVRNVCTELAAAVLATLLQNHPRPMLLFSIKFLFV